MAYQRAALANTEQSLLSDTSIFSASLELSLPVCIDFGAKEAAMMLLLDIPPFVAPGTTTEALS